MFEHILGARRLMKRSGYLGALRAAQEDTPTDSPTRKKKKKKKKASLRPKTRNSLMSKTRRPQNRPLMNPGFATDLYRPATPRLGY